MYARTNRCYNERGSRTNCVRSSIPHCISIVCAVAGTKSLWYKSTFVSFIKNWSFQNKTIYRNEKVFFSSLPTEKLLTRDTAYLGVDVLKEGL